MRDFTKNIKHWNFPPKMNQIGTMCLVVLTLFAIGAVLRLTGSIFIPFVIALLLSFLCAPAVDFLISKRIPRAFAILIMLLILIAFGYLIFLVVYSSITSLLSDFPKYQARISQMLNLLMTRFSLPEDIARQMEVTRTLGNALLTISGNFTSFIGGFMLTLTFLLFLLIEKPFVRRKMDNSFNTDTNIMLKRVLNHINQQISHYLAVKLLTSLLTAVIIYTAFALIGVDFPFIWAILTFLFNFIPSIGSIIITIFASLFAIVQFLPNWNLTLLAILSMSITQLLIGNFIDPKMLGNRLNLSPVFILFSLLVWGWIWSAAGLFLAVPLTVTLKIFCENIPVLRPLGILMGTGSSKQTILQHNPSEKGT